MQTAAPNVQKSSPIYDVVVVGSGAGGGTTVQVLTQLGVSVALLEAGPLLNPGKDFKEHKWPSDYDHRGGLNGGMYDTTKYQPFSFWSAPNGYWDIEGDHIRWHREAISGGSASRILGGRTNHYGRITLRFADYDFCRIPSMAMATIGRLLTTRSCPITKKQSALLEFVAPKKESAVRRMEFSSPSPRRAFTKFWCRRQGRNSAFR
ncbi:MAG: hypothetical protein WKF37_01520 [Bryobacteraceae bacterium]